MTALLPPASPTLRTPVDQDRVSVFTLSLLATPLVVLLLDSSLLHTFVPALAPAADAATRYLVVLAGLPLVFQHPSLSRIRLTWPVLAWGLAALLSLLVATPPAGWTLTGAVSATTLYIGPWFVASTRLGPADAARLVRLVSVLPGLAAVLGIALGGAGLVPLFEQDATTGGLRLGGLLIAAGWAALAVPGSVAAGMRIAVGDSRGWLLLGVNAVILAASQGRGAGLAFVAGTYPVIALAIRRHPHWRASRYLLRGLLILVAVVSGLLGAVEVVSSRSDIRPVPLYLSGVVEESDPTSGRGRAWAYYLDHWIEQPLFGQGPSAVYVLSQEAPGYIGENFKAAHNEYVQTLVEFGVVGLVLIGSAVLAEGRHVRRSASPAVRPFATSILLAFAVLAVTDNATAPLFAVPVTLLLAACATYGRVEGRAAERGRSARVHAGGDHRAQP